jgi:hypothetical protein
LLQRLTFRSDTSSAHSASSTNHTPDHIGMVRPRNADSGHPLHVQLALINALDRSFQLRDGGGVGVFAPQWGPRRGAYLSLQQDF